MNKEEILKKIKSDNAFFDEREDYELGVSFGFGAIVVGIFCVFFSILYAIKGQRFYEFGSILFGYMAAVGWRTYVITKKKRFLSQAIACSIAVVLAVVGYFFVG